MQVTNALAIVMIVISIYAVLGVNFFFEDDPDNFATFAISFLTMFQISTGDYWGTIARTHVDDQGNLKVSAS